MLGESLSITPAVVFVAGARHQRHPHQHRHPGQRVLCRAAGRGLAGPRPDAAELRQRDRVSRQRTSDNVPANTLNQVHVGTRRRRRPADRPARRRRLPQPLRPAHRLRRLRARQEVAPHRNRARGRGDAPSRRPHQPARQRHRRAGCATTPTRRTRVRACSRTSIATSRSTAARPSWRSPRCRRLGRRPTTTPTASFTRRSAMATACADVRRASSRRRRSSPGEPRSATSNTSGGFPGRLRRSGVQSRAVVDAGAVLPRRLRPAHHRIQLRSEQGFYVSNGIDVYGPSRSARGGRFSAEARSAAWSHAGRWRSRAVPGLELYKAGWPAARPVLKLGADVERYVTGGPGGFDGVRATFSSYTEADPPAAPRSAAAGRFLMCNSTRVRSSRLVAPGRRVARRRASQGLPDRPGRHPQGRGLVAARAERRIHGRRRRCDHPAADRLGEGGRADHRAGREATSAPGSPTAMSSTRRSRSASRSSRASACSWSARSARRAWCRCRAR